MKIEIREQVSLRGEAEMVEMFGMDKPVRGSEIEMLAILLSSLQPTPHLHLSADKYVCYLASHVALWVLLIGSEPHVLSTVGFIRRLREKNSKETDMDRKSHTIFFTSDQPITRS
jgi:hypothetical protein